MISESQNLIKMQMVSVSAISRSDILRGVDLDLYKGEVVMLLGPSGCGKSSLLRCLAGLDPIESGTIRLKLEKDAEWQHLNLCSNIHPLITIVFQQLFLWPHLSNMQNIEVVASAAMTNLSTRGFENLKRALGLEGFLSKFPNQSSLGQRQRIAIARSLMARPKILLLDEITSALDSAVAQQVGMLLRTSAFDGMTILCVTHDLEFAKAFGDRILRMEHGRLFENAEPTKLNTT